MMTGQTQRRDIAWQREEAVESYFASRPGIPLADVQLDVMRRLIEEHGVEVRHLLDLGAGDGAAAAAVNSWREVERMVLVDFSHPMLDEARLRFMGVPSEIDYVEGDLLHSDWVDEVAARGPFDAAVSRYAIHHLPHERKRTLYAEVFELLRPGGIFINIEHVQSASPVYQRAWDRLMIEGIQAHTPDPLTFQATTDAYLNRQDGDSNILAPVEEQCDWLRAIGFVDVDVAFKLFELAVFVGRRPT